jgi:hypothetical protein
MHEQQDWTPADDEVVRGTLNTLRLDAEALPLADVRFVKARGVARRRRTQVVGVAAAPSATAPSSTNSTELLAHAWWRPSGNADWASPRRSMSATWGSTR